jgi:hypothetical protein
MKDERAAAAQRSGGFSTTDNTDFTDDFQNSSDWWSIVALFGEALATAAW